MIGSTERPRRLLSRTSALLPCKKSYPKICVDMYSFKHFNLSWKKTSKYTKQKHLLCLEHLKKEVSIFMFHAVWVPSRFGASAFGVGFFRRFQETPESDSRFCERPPTVGSLSRKISPEISDYQLPKRPSGGRGVKFQVCRLVCFWWVFWGERISDRRIQVPLHPLRLSCAMSCQNIFSKNPSRDDQGNTLLEVGIGMLHLLFQRYLVSFFVQSVVFRQENLQCTAAFVPMITRTAYRSRKAIDCLAVAADSAVSRCNSNLGIRNPLVRRPRALCS